MCLITRYAATKKFIEDNKHKKTIDVYKFFSWYKFSEQFYSPFQGSSIQPGYLISDYKKPNFFKRKFYKFPSLKMENIHGGGIHVFLNEIDAKSCAHNYNGAKLVFACEAEVKDLVAVGDFDLVFTSAVFTKIHIPQNEFTIRLEEARHIFRDKTENFA